ncbi:hypothetical protein [Lactococcus cremoris]|nr:hypothetical protein [Lactococcus cremoris]
MYNNDDFRQYFANFISTGILANVPLAGSTAFQVTQTDSPSMNVIVGSGVAWIIGGQVMNTSPLSFKIPAPLTSQSRTDSIVVQWSNSSNNGDIVYKQNSTQVVQSNDVYELQLCKILVPANATNIPQSNITDMRADPTVCGFSSPYEAIKTGDLLAQFKSELEANGVLFEDWFKNLKKQLDDNQASNLQNQIDNLGSEKANDHEVVHKTGDESIAGKKTFTGDVEVNGRLTLPTKSWSGELGGGIILSLRKKGTTVEYSIGGEISSSILANSNLVNLSVPNEFRPRNRYSLVGHMVGGWNAFHIDIPSSGVCQWFGPTASSGTPRGTGTYPID